jgi:hypothetical protein
MGEHLDWSSFDWLPDSGLLSQAVQGLAYTLVRESVCYRGGRMTSFGEHAAATP